jgi:methionine-rich copper-binding protein CopC
VVAAPPAQVEVWFTQDMFRRQSANWITVAAPDGTAAHTGESQIDDDDRRHLTVALKADLPPGEYTVVWHTLSADDGDDHEGNFTFTYDPQAEVTSTPMLAATATLAPTNAPAATAVPATAAPSGGGGCGAALAPAAGLVVVGLNRRRAVRARVRP